MLKRGVDRLREPTRGDALPASMPFASAAWKRSHAQATATRQSGDLGISAVSETRKIAAILVADVVGYSRLAGADEDRALARLRAVRSDLIDPLHVVHHGRVVKRTGDGAIVEFRSVVDAVRCAIEVQSGLAERNAEVAPDKRIEFRVGIHLGDVVEEEDGDLMGDGVNISACLQGVAKPGTICLSAREADRRSGCRRVLQRCQQLRHFQPEQIFSTGRQAGNDPAGTVKIGEPDHGSQESFVTRVQP
jgi:class 3 adenylate cyclase